MKYNENYLEKYNTFFRAVDTEFRNRVCNDCGWSKATYYRKLQPGKSLSPVELKAIQEIGKDLAKNLLEIEKKGNYRLKPGSYSSGLL